MKINADFYGMKATTSYNWIHTFTGQILDTETGLMLYRNRVYHPTLGRFLQRDPIGYNGDSVNLLRYVYNSPKELSDALGFGFCDNVCWFITCGWEGFCTVPGTVYNIGVGIGETACEMGCQAIDVGGGVITAGSLVTGNPVYFEPWSNAGQALDSGACTTRGYYGNVALNTVTCGTASQCTTLYDYSQGRITADECSKRMGTVGVMQLGSAYCMQQQGGVFTQPIQKIPSHVSGVFKGGPIELSPNALSRFQRDPVCRQLINCAKEEPIAYGRLRTYEACISETDILCIQRSGRFGASIPESVRFPAHVKKPVCALPKAMVAAEQNGGIGIVTKGGFMVKDGKIIYMPPCSKGCAPVFQDPSFSVHSIQPVTPLECVPPVLGYPQIAAPSIP